MKSAIIAGATGFIGVHLIAELMSHGVEVTALCRAESSHIGRLPRDVRIECDVDKLPTADVFFHLAWEGASGPGRSDAALQARNAEMTLNALVAAHKSRCKRFVALGTVYERFAPHIRASGRFGGSDFYVLSKDYAHAMAAQLAYKLGIGFVWCTICHPIGAYIKQEQMMAYAVSSLLAGISPAFGPAQTPYDIIAVEDVARGLYLVGVSELSRRNYYIGSGAPKPLRDWLEDARAVLGVSTPIGIGERPDDGLCFDEGWFDITPLSGDTGYTPKISFADGVNNAARWLMQ